MKRLHRLTALLIKLQSNTFITTTILAQEFKVSKRTIYRDIAALSDAGVPIGIEDAKGYFLVEGYQLPPVLFTEVEARAMLTAEQVINQNSDLSLVDGFKSAMEKVIAVLKTIQKEELHILRKRISPSTSRTTAQTNWLLTIENSIAKRITLQIEYQSGYNNTFSKRKVEPLAVYFTQDHWILVAYCLLRKANREFRLDRIISLAHTNDIFPPNQFELGDYFKKA